MKIYAVSDMHGNLDGIDPTGCDFCVIAGDFAKFEGFKKWGVVNQARWVQDEFFKFIESFPETQFVIVPGNHDLFADPAYYAEMKTPCISLKWPKNSRMLVNSGCEINGVRFWGSPNVPIINYSWAFETEHDKLIERFSKIPENTDVLITHSPPRIPNAYVDVSLEYGMHSDRFGSSELTHAIFDKKPKRLFCGHIHSGDHNEVEFEGCKIRNVSRVDENYEIAYEPAIIEI